VASHPVHGSLITVRIEGAPAAQRADLEREIHKRLDPLVMKHELVWS
jgi:fatty-acyl-CoA synthase